MLSFYFKELFESQNAGRLLETRSSYYCNLHKQTEREQCLPAANRWSSTSLEISFLSIVLISINSVEPSIFSLQRRKFPNLLGGSNPFSLLQLDIKLYNAWLGVRIVLERICNVLGHVPCPALNHFFMQARS